MDVREDLITKKQAWIELRRREGVEGVFRATALNLPMPPALQDALLVPRAQRAVIPHICRTALVERGGNPAMIGELVRALTEDGASAFLVSTFADEGGMGYEDILMAAQNTHAPVICRDVFLDPIQVTIARAHGAAAIMLCADLLDDRALRNLRRSAQEMSLDTILDVSSVRHLENTSRNRSGMELRVFGADLLCVSRMDAERLRERLADAKPEHTLAIAALSEGTPGQAAALEDAGYSAFVVDVSLADIGEARARFRDAAGDPRVDVSVRS